MAGGGGSDGAWLTVSTAATVYVKLHCVHHSDEEDGGAGR